MSPNRKQPRAKAKAASPKPSAAPASTVETVDGRELLKWAQLVLRLEAAGFGPFGRYTYKDWMDETPPVPIAKPAARRGDPHFFDPEAVLAWITERQARLQKGYTPRGGAPAGTSGELRPEDPIVSYRRVKAMREELRLAQEMGHVVDAEEWRDTLVKLFKMIGRRLGKLEVHLRPIIGAANAQVVGEEVRQICIELSTSADQLLAHGPDTTSAEG